MSMQKIFLAQSALLLGLTIATLTMNNNKEHSAKPQPLLSTVAQEMMDMPRCKGSGKDSLSQARRAILSQQIDRILTATGGTRDTQETFILLLCIETKFRSGLKSSAGAIGIAQLMPATAKAEAKSLGLGDLNNEDLMDPEINLTLGYRHFLSLVQEFNGNHAKAAAAYNGGTGGSTVKGLTSGAPGAAETDKYVRDLFYLKEARRVAQGAVGD